MNCEWKRDDVYGNNIQVNGVGSANVGISRFDGGWGCTIEVVGAEIRKMTKIGEYEASCHEL